MIMELLIEETVFTVIETTTPELEFETYQAMFPNITSWRERKLTEEEQHEQIRQRRERLYCEHIDPITAQISRLRDMEPRSTEVDLLITKRSALVEQIKESNPYSETEVQNV